MSNTDLSKRWTDAFVGMTNQFKHRPDHHTELALSPFGLTSSGRVDYRNWILKEALQRTRITNTDFSRLRCEWAGAFSDCIVEKCVFDWAKLSGRHVGKSFTDCSFLRATLRQSPMAGHFVRCDFSYANLDGASARDAHFISCNFTEADFCRALFTHCRMENCTFNGVKFHNGSFSGTRFSGGSPDPDALGNTLMDHVKFD